MNRRVGVLAVQCLLALALLGSRAHVQAGTLYYSHDRDSNGLYTIDVFTGVPSHVGFSSVNGETVGLAPSGDASLLYGSQPFRFLHINADGSGVVGLDPYIGIEGLAYDPSADLVYGAINAAFFTVDHTTGLKITNLAGPGHDVEGLAYYNGTVYGLAGRGSGGIPGTLLSYAIGAGTWTTIGFTGISFDQAGLAYDTDRHVLYAIGSQDPNLYLVNPLTAAMSVIGDTGFADAGGGLAYIDGYAPIPEPTTSALLLVGLGAVGLKRRRRKE